ncbi:unnamed protein product, partial [Timema podura]|nr:unnamed protein product [Timema podura]
FHFSKDEPTALVQSDGGPCAVLAPVQAFIFKSLLTDKSGINWKEVDVKKCNKYLVQAVCDILAQAISDTEGTFIVVHMNEHCDANSVPQMNMVENHQVEDGTVPSELVEKSAGHEKLEHEHFHSHLKTVKLEGADTSKNTSVFAAVIHLLKSDNIASRSKLISSGDKICDICRKVILKLPKIDAEEVASQSLESEDDNIGTEIIEMSTPQKEEALGAVNRSLTDLD